jgi:peptidoglycan/LPS O-acetylase OafA/YrhL
MPPTISVLPSATLPDKRIAELESIRGIAALLVVIYHIPNWNPAIFDVAIFRNSYLMVELFFVLSGFVIYRAYADNIPSRGKLLRFQFLRFCRLYPVHLLFLLFFLLLECVKYVADVKFGIKSSKTTPFVENSWSAFVQQIFLLQSIGDTGNALTFNAPAWSISVEFYTYLLFGLIVLYMGRFKTAIFALLAVLALVVLVVQPLNGYADLLKCIAGFFLGCCTAWLAGRVNFVLRPYALALACLGLLLFLQLKTNESYDIAIYFLTAALILAIVHSDIGAIRKALQLRLFTWLGTISYSVYMSHSAVLWCFNQIQRFFFKRPEIWIGGRLVPQLTFVQAFVSCVLALLLVLLVANLVYLKIEKPFRDRSRKLVFEPVPPRTAGA